MPWYFFNTRDDGDVIIDVVGVEVADLEAVKKMAARGLAELALDVLPASTERVLAIDVRDEQSAPVLTAELIFKAKMLAA